MKLRISTVQYALKPIQSFDDFAKQIRLNVKISSDSGANFVLFPEYLTTQLMSFFELMPAQFAIRRLSTFTEQYINLFSGLAKEYNLHIIGGTHITKEKDKYYNTAYLFYPDGKFLTQNKLHLTPTEKNIWHLDAGNNLSVFDTEFTKITVLICYDVEFPETARLATDKGTEIIFCPSCTDDEYGYYRVRYCCQARAIENQLYVINSGTVGNFPVENMESNFGQAAIFSPCDIPFAKAGVVNQGIANNEMVVTGEINLLTLRENRIKGSVTPLKDRRKDLY